MFRSVAILQGVAKRAQEGNASSDKAGRMGLLVKPLAKVAVELIDWLHRPQHICFLV